MIHAFALEPNLVATWGRRDAFRFFHDKFGLGTPRVLLELPLFKNWKRDVYRAANDLNLSQEDMKRIEELFRMFGEHKCRRVDSVYDGLLSWIENAEREYDRKPFAAILASQNPRRHVAVIEGEHLDLGTARWDCPTGATLARTPASFAAALSAMLLNCTELHLVDPHFGPENRRHRIMLEALMDVLSKNGITPDVIRVHCSGKSDLAFFEQQASRMAAYLSASVCIEFQRWDERDGGEKLHNRYVLTDLGGVSLGIGLDEGESGQTDDVLLLPRAQYEFRWSQYVSDDGSFRQVDSPPAVQGRRALPSSKGNA